MPAEQLQKLKHYKDVLHRMIPYLRVPKERVPKEFNQDKVDAFEKQIVNIMETFKRRRNVGPGGQQQPPGAPPGAGQQQLAEQQNAPPNVLQQVQAQQQVQLPQQPQPVLNSGF
jgi:PAX-interacting protein 1